MELPMAIYDIDVCSLNVSDDGKYSVNVNTNYIVYIALCAPLELVRLPFGVFKTCLYDHSPQIYYIHFM